MSRSTGKGAGGDPLHHLGGSHIRGATGGRQLSRRGFLRGSVLAGAAAGAPSLVTACGGAEDSSGDLLASLRDAGSIKVGFANEAPYGFRNSDGDLTGEAPEVAREVLNRLGIPKLEGVLTDFGSLIPGLRARNYDIVAAGMAVTPERCQQVIFSDPDYRAAQVLVVKKGNPQGLSNLDSIASTPEAEVAILQGGLVLEWARASGIQESQITTLSDTQSLLGALQSSRVDAFTLTAPSAAWLVKTANDPQLEMVDPFVPVVDGEEQASYGAYGFRPGNDTFRDAFNSELSKMQRNGEVFPIVKDYGFDQESIDAAKDKTADGLCGNAD